MQKYECTYCGEIYDPEKGNEFAGVEPGTSWDELPEDFVCPLCGTDKENFEPMK